MARSSAPVKLNISTDLPEGLIDRLDGVLVTGGVDVEPSAYGQDRVPEVEEVDPARDSFEFALIRRLVECNTPTLGICRGIQSVAVAMGGELTQHVDDHMRADLHNQTAHTVEIEADSRLASIVGVSTQPSCQGELRNCRVGRSSVSLRNVGSEERLISHARVCAKRSTSAGG